MRRFLNGRRDYFKRFLIGSRSMRYALDLNFDCQGPTYDDIVVTSDYSVRFRSRNREARGFRAGCQGTDIPKVRYNMNCPKLAFLASMIDNTQLASMGRLSIATPRRNYSKTQTWRESCIAQLKLLRAHWEQEGYRKPWESCWGHGGWAGKGLGCLFGERFGWFHLIHLRDWCW